MRAALQAVEEMWRTRDFARMRAHAVPEVVLDWSNSVGPHRGVYRGVDEARRFFESFVEATAAAEWTPVEPVALGDRLALGASFSFRGGASGAGVTASGGQLWTFAGDRVASMTLFQSRSEALRAMRAAAIAEARLYFVCEARPAGRDPAPLLDAALRGGADVVQMREKAARGIGELASLAEPFRGAAREHGALFLVNDRPDLVEPCGADGVHVGQEDAPVAEARRRAGDAALVGLSTHAPAQLDAACAAAGDARPDYLSVGPVWATPTKEGRPAAGLDYVRYAAARATVPWFAIGGIDRSNVAAVAEAGAEQLVVVRAIRDAADPEDAARSLREAIAHEPVAR